MSESGKSKTDEERREALVQKLTANVIGALDLVSVYLGDRLGLYRALANHPGATPSELAAVADLHPRYVREWLEQQTVSGILETPNADADDEERSYRLPSGYAEVLLDESSLHFTAPLAEVLVLCLGPLQMLLEAFRTGGGVPYAAYGVDGSQARGTRAMYEQLLAREWLPAIPGLHQRLLDDPPARIADVACGRGHSTLAIARGYPKVRVDGIDLDEISIAAARRLLADSGLEGRVAFHHRDASDPDLSGRYDLITLFEALHDMAYPIDVLRTLRGMLVDGGCVLVADVRTAERFSPDADDNERLSYGFSLLHCLPVGMNGENAAGTGAMMRPSTVRQYAADAGFTSFEIQPIDDESYRFYLLAG